MKLVKRDSSHSFQSRPHTSKSVTRKSDYEAKHSFPNVDVALLLPLAKSSVIYNPNLPLAPPPTPIESAFPH